MNNDFFNQKVEGPKKELSISEVIYLALGGGIFFSKRLAPAMTICNGRIYANDEFVFSADLEIPKITRKLEHIARTFDVVLTIVYESGNKVLWSSNEPTKWNGYWTTKDGVEVEQSELYEALPFYEKLAEQRRRSWMLDHGLRRRNPKEWWNDFYYYRIKCSVYAIHRYFKKKNP
jgi:hypothetical protein